MSKLENIDKESGFPERLKEAIGTKSNRAFALECGVSPTALHQYASGKSDPTRAVLVAIAKTAGVGLKWLATGEGEMRQDKEAVTAAASINKDLLASILEAWISLEHNGETPPTPKMQAENIALFYDLLHAYYSKDETTVESLKRFISAFSDLSKVAVKHSFANNPDAIETIIKAMVEGDLFPGIKKVNGGLIKL